MITAAAKSDLPEIMSIFENAKVFMRRCGNMGQWTGGYPSAEVVGKDIEDGNFYVERNGDRITGVFAFIVGPDPTYGVIDGEWLNDLPYGTVHRIASDGVNKGGSDRCFEFCLARTGNVRVDTHHDNRPMQRCLERNGFKYCGVIRLADGSPRKAYQKSIV